MSYLIILIFYKKEQNFVAFSSTYYLFYSKCIYIKIHVCMCISPCVCACTPQLAYKVTETQRSHHGPTNKCDKRYVYIS